jgi:hypothetical protein
LAIDGPCVGERPATHTGVLRGIFNPREKEEEPQVLGSERGEFHEKAGGTLKLMALNPLPSGKLTFL